MDYRVLSPINFRVPKFAFLLALSIYILYSKRIYSANGISRSFLSSHKCFFKTYKNAFKWNVSNWD